MPSRYTFSEYSPDWPREFEREAKRLRGLLNDELVDVHHVGSTSVPGLAAKPIIDLIPVVRDIAEVDARQTLLVQAGYKAWGELGIEGRRYLTRDCDGLRTHNVHVFAIGNPHIERHLAFCAYLRSHPMARDEYAALKRDVYAKHPADIEKYRDGKDAWIKALEPIAVEWYRSAAR
jgi:GrpB-like predicted nucleotidyltransferase (UPF0157 family)